MRLDWKQIVPALLVGCLLGFWGGALLGHRRPPPPKTDRMLEKFSAELRLDPDQKAALKIILEQQIPRFSALRTRTDEELKEMRSSMNKEIDKLLKPEQQARFQELQARWETRHGRRKDRR